MSELSQKIFSIAGQVFSVPTTDLSPDMAVGDIPQWDSFAQLNLLMAVEQEFEIAFSVDDTLEMETLEDIAETTERYLNG